MSSLTDTIYRHCPVWLQNAGISAFGYAWRRRRFGGRFRALVNEFCARDRLTPEQWRDYQTLELRSLLRCCLEHVPYYRDSRTLGLTRGDAESFGLDDLKRLPVLEKETLQADSRLHIASNAPRTLHEYSTSGSTGTPLVIRMSAAILALPWALPLLFGGVWRPAGAYGAVLAISAFFTYLTNPLDKACLVVGAWWYISLWNAARTATTAMVAGLALLFQCGMDAFINALVIQQVALYLVDFWAERLFSHRTPPPVANKAE